MVNSVTLIGRLTAAPEIRTASDGKEVCRFMVAINYKKADGSTPAEYYDCAAWDKLGQTIARCFHKGDYIGVRGQLSVRSYQTKHKDYAKSATVIVKDFSFCGKSPSDGGGNSDDDYTVSAGCAEDDLPF